MSPGELLCWVWQTQSSWGGGEWGTTMVKAELIGGRSWVATAQYYRRLNELTQDALGVASA